MKNKIMLIDGNNAIHRAYYKFKNLKHEGRNTGMVYGFPYILNSLIKSHLPDDVIVVFDGGRDKKRTEHHPDYKKRDKKIDFDADDFYRQRDEVLKILLCLGIKTITQKKKEADDIIWLLTRRLKRNNQVLIVSSDKDFNQLISKNVSIWNPKAETRYTHKNLEKEVGYKPEQCVDYLILDGDASDNIKGMPGVGPKYAINFLKEHSIESYLTSSSKELNKFPRKELESVFLFNRKLIDIKRFVRKYMSLRDVKMTLPKKAKINHTELAYLCSNHGINTFQSEKFTNAFEKLLKKNQKNTLCQKYLSQVSVVSVKQL